MKYYIYLSQAKIDMLYHQATRKRDNVSVKGGINIGVLSIETESSREISLYDKLDVIINEMDDIGDVYSDAEYVQGKVVMGWNARNKLNRDSNATYWIGESFDNDGVLNKILLIGSQHHILGNSNNTDFCYSTSYIDAFLNDIEKNIDFDTLEYKSKSSQSEIQSERDKRMIENLKEKNVSISDIQRCINAPYLTNFIDEFSERHNGTFQEYEFVAKLLYSEIKLDDAGNMIRYAIATPIYVSLTPRINPRVSIESGIKKYILTTAEFQQYKLHNFSTIHLLLKRNGLDETKFTEEMKLQYEKSNGKTDKFDREKFISKAVDIVKKYFYII